MTHLLDRLCVMEGGIIYTSTRSKHFQYLYGAYGKSATWWSPPSCLYESILTMERPWVLLSKAPLRQLVLKDLTLDLCVH